MRVLRRRNSDVSVIEDEAIMIDFVGDEGADKRVTVLPIRGRRRGGERGKAHRDELEGRIDELLCLGRSIDIEGARSPFPASVEKVAGHHISETHVMIGVQVREENGRDLARSNAGLDESTGCADAAVDQILVSVHFE
jgi:hypothetical protein